MRVEPSRWDACPYKRDPKSSLGPGGLVVKNPPANAGDMGSISGLGRSPGERNDKPLQYSCLENPMDRGTWWTTVRGVIRKSDTV